MFINNTGAFLTSDHYQVISIFNANAELDHYQVYYNYESGNRLDINHIIQDGEELLGKLPMNVFNEISDILHKDHMIQGDAEPDADCDVKTDINIKLIQAVSRYEDMYNDKQQLLMILEQFEASLLQIREYSSNDWVYVQGHNEFNITTKMMEIKNIKKQLEEYNVR